MAEKTEQARAACKERIEKPVDTCFGHWIDGRVGNFGGFQTKLFLAYCEADSGNRARLNAAFPHWFVETYAL